MTIAPHELAGGIIIAVIVIVLTGQPYRPDCETDMTVRTESRTEMATAVIILKWAAGIIAAFLVASLGYLMSRTVDRLDKIDARMTAMEMWRAEASGNRFTSTDGQKVWEKIAELQREMAAMPREVPPAWFVKRVDTLETKVDRNAEQLAKIEAMLKNGKAGG